MEYRFTLIHDSVNTSVLQPNGWDAFRSAVSRDFKAHGAVYKFTDGSLKLSFADGRDVFSNALENYGLDALVEFVADRRKDEFSEWQNVFTGTAIMKTGELDIDSYSVDFENVTFQQKIKNRIDNKVRLNTSLDLDGGTLNGAIPTQTEDWNTISIDRNYRAALLGRSPQFPANPLVQNITNTDASDGDTVFFYTGFDAEDYNSVEDITLGCRGDAGATKSPYGEDGGAKPFFISKLGGELSVNGSATLRVSFSNLQVTAPLPTDVRFHANVYIKQYRGTSFFALVESHQIDTNTETVSFNFSPASHIMSEVDVNFSNTFTVEQGDLFYFVIETEVQFGTSNNDSIQTNVQLLGHDASSGRVFGINMNLVPEILSKEVDFWLIHDVFDRISYILSGKEDSFYSEFFGRTDHGYASNGCGSLNAITTGNELRGLDEFPTLSLRECLEWASSRYGIGWGFENTGYGYRLRVEPMSFFYQDVEIIDLGGNINEEGSYKETIFEPLLYNRVDIGYKQYNNQLLINNNFSDFLTKSEYSLPISSIEGEYSKLSPFIASNDLIQATYEQFDDSKSWKYDQSIFIIALQKPSVSYIPENDENFETVTGLSDRSSAYNIRHATYYMMLEHANLINSTLYGKSGSELIQNTNIKVNVGFASRYNDGEDCLLGDSQRLLREAIGNITISNNNSGGSLWKPITHHLTVAMSKEQLDLVIDSLEGNSPSTDHGYITYRDDNGVIKRGFVLDIRWNHVDEISSIETLEKA